MPASVAEQLFAEPFAYDFFQAVRLLERLDPRRLPVGRSPDPAREVARFKTLASLSFPPSSIYELVRGARDGGGQPTMTVTFLSLLGPQGALPRHYTDLAMRLAREFKHADRFAFHDWLDLFNNRFVGFFFRAWEKYRPGIAFERGEFSQPEPDIFTLALLSLAGLGTRRLRQRLVVRAWSETDGERWKKALVRVDDLSLLFYSGLFADRRRSAAGLTALLRSHFDWPVAIEQFQGQWLRLSPENQTRLAPDGNAALGVSAVVGQGAWDVTSKFRVRVGPVDLAEFTDLLPDPMPRPISKSFFVLCHLVRLYAGPDLDFDVQLVLRHDSVPPCRLGGAAAGRLGWNTWLAAGDLPADADDAVFDSQIVFDLEPAAGAA